MRHSTFLHISRDIWRLLLPVLAAAVLVSLSLDATWPSLLGLLIASPLVMFGRDADRMVPPHPLGLVAPVDGRIVHRRECHDPYLDRAAIRLSIEVNRFGVYHLRAPTEGTLMEVRSCRRCPDIDRTSWIRTDEADDVVIVVSQGSLLGQRPCNAGFGQRVGQGRRCGLRRLARQIDLYIPASCRVDVQLGDKVRAGTDVLATMMHNVNKPDSEKA